MTPFMLPLLTGILCGLRTMTPLAMVSWAAVLGRLSLDGSFLSFLATPVAAWVLTLFALGELVADKLPFTPSRKVPMQFGARIVSGAVCGAALATPAGLALAGAALGVVGAIIGTLGGAAVRGRLAARFGRDLPAALIEDAIAVFGALLILGSLQ
ncbi:DUF4126 family protein [Roseixanthobacter pseudopolyaromaticivorans]|uniref:DUF4126 family protein n=1 Tax=Xanthobacteraceae TaxID=335928 RepID=UPI0037284573